MKIWRAGRHLLVAQGDGRFVLVDASGAIIKDYAPTAWAYDEDLGRTHHVVLGGQLRLQTRIEGGRGVLRSEDELVLDDLCPADDPDTVAFVETALGDAAVGAEERQQAWERSAEARVSAIDGARTELGPGVALASTQRALCERIYRHDDARAAALLRTLVDLARTGVRGPALDAFVEGCAHACFQCAEVRDGGDQAEPMPMIPPHPLAATVAAHARELDVEADCQERVDAHANARAFWAAARAIRHAAALLGLPVSPLSG